MARFWGSNSSTVLQYSWGNWDSCSNIVPISLPDQLHHQRSCKLQTECEHLLAAFSQNLQRAGAASARRLGRASKRSKPARKRVTGSRLKSLKNLTQCQEVQRPSGPSLQVEQSQVGRKPSSLDVSSEDWKLALAVGGVVVSFTNGPCCRMANPIAWAQSHHS